MRFRGIFSRQLLLFLELVITRIIVEKIKEIFFRKFEISVPAERLISVFKRLSFTALFVLMKARKLIPPLTISSDFWSD